MSMPVSNTVEADFLLFKGGVPCEDDARRERVVLSDTSGNVVPFGVLVEELGYD